MKSDVEVFSFCLHVIDSSMFFMQTDTNASGNYLLSNVIIIIEHCGNSTKA